MSLTVERPLEDQKAQGAEDASSSLVPEDDILFMGLGQATVAWYRCYLPALFLGADWSGVVGEPGRWTTTTGMVKRQSVHPDPYTYKVVVIQQPHGQKWLNFIRDLQEHGIKVIFEVDDYLHAIRKQEDHDFRQNFDKDFLKRVELCMRACDAMICSTDYIARRYRQFNKQVYVCENGLDTARYRLTRPKRPTVNIGWAGATAHVNAVVPWLEVVARVMARRDNTCFVSIGQAFAQALEPQFGDRTITTPFTLIETYPSAMTMFDIALAPAGKTNFFRGKSDLRWLEAGALGVPTIADPTVYPKIEHGVNGFHAENPEEVEHLLHVLIENEELRTEVGENAREYVRRERDMSVMCANWLRVIEEVANA